MPVDRGRSHAATVCAEVGLGTGEKPLRTQAQDQQPGDAAEEMCPMNTHERIERRAVRIPRCRYTLSEEVGCGDGLYAEEHQSQRNRCCKPAPVNHDQSMPQRT